MIEILLGENSVKLHDHYRMIKSTTKVKNVKGELKEYINYTCSFPYTFYEMYGCPNQIYFYKYEGCVYVTNKEPKDVYDYQAVKLHNRKNALQKSSHENEDKSWAKLITIPKKVFGRGLGRFKTFHYMFFCDKRDFSSGDMGLLEVYPSLEEF